MAIFDHDSTLNGTEEQWILRLYACLTSIPGATVDPPLENYLSLFGDSETAYSISFKYKSIEIILTRKAILSKPTNSLTISIPNSQINDANFYWMSSKSTASQTKETSRKLKFKAIVSDFAFEIIFNSLVYLFFPIKEGDVDTYLYKNNTSAISDTSSLSSQIFYKSGEEEQYKIKQLLPFEIPNNDIKMLDRTFLVTSTATADLVMDLPGVNSCTTVPGNKKITINNKEYFSISTDVIVEI